MLIYGNYLDGDDEADLMPIEWPSDWRMPVAGETILIGIGTFVVHRVQWELQQGDAKPTVQLDLADPPRAVS